MFIQPMILSFKQLKKGKYYIRMQLLQPFLIFKNTFDAWSLEAKSVSLLLFNHDARLQFVKLLIKTAFLNNS